MDNDKKPGYLVFRVWIWVGFLVLAISSSQWFILDANQEVSNIPPEPYLSNIANHLDQQSVLIPSGEFLMGSDTARHDEEPAHLVYLDSYYLDKYEITNIQYRRFLLEFDIEPPRYWSETTFPSGQEFFPVVGVRWKDAQAYCTWMGKRLPTEAEWEKACRGSGGWIYPWGNDPKLENANTNPLPGGPNPDMWDQAWDWLRIPQGDGKPVLKPVNSHPSGVSPYGIFNLMGNASEWTADYYNWDGYWNISNKNPIILEPEWNHVVRGSAWFMPYGLTLAGHDLNRCSARSSSHGDTRDARIGFRCATSFQE